MNPVAIQSTFEVMADVLEDKSRSAVFTDGQIIEAAFKHFRSSGFPYRRLSIHACMQEINDLAVLPDSELANSILGYQVADTYHPHRYHGNATGMKSPHDAFNDDKLLKRALQLTRDYGARIGDGFFGKLSIVSGVQACSNFSPGFAASIYRRFALDGATILDTSTGYGGRLVGYIASQIKGRYIGIDPSTLTYRGNSKMAEDLGVSDQVELYNLPAEDVPIGRLANRCDLAFTSPPYIFKEHYSDEKTQSSARYLSPNAWFHGFLEPMMALQFAALRPGCKAIVNVADVELKGKRWPLVAWTKEAAKKSGFSYVDTERFLLARRFGAGQPDEIASEAVIIFQKDAAEVST